MVQIRNMFQTRFITYVSLMILMDGMSGFPRADGLDLSTGSGSQADHYGRHPMFVGAKLMYHLSSFVNAPWFLQPHMPQMYCFGRSGFSLVLSVTRIVQKKSDEFMDSTGFCWFPLDALPSCWGQDQRSSRRCSVCNSSMWWAEGEPRSGHPRSRLLVQEAIVTWWLQWMEHQCCKEFGYNTKKELCAMSCRIFGSKLGTM